MTRCHVHSDPSCRNGAIPPAHAGTSGLHHIHTPRSFSSSTLGAVGPSPSTRLPLQLDRDRASLNSQHEAAIGTCPEQTPDGRDGPCQLARYQQRPKHCIFESPPEYPHTRAGRPRVVDHGRLDLCHRPVGGWVGLPVGRAAYPCDMASLQFPHDRLESIPLAPLPPALGFSRRFPTLFQCVTVCILTSSSPLSRERDCA
jgi:hypothetical protein